MKRLVPYPTLAGEISLEVREVNLDGTRLKLNMISHTNRVVALHQIERTDWTEARLMVRLRAPSTELNSGPWTDTVFAVVLSERATGIRVAEPLHAGSDNTWDGVITLHRAHHLGQVKLRGQVVATVNDVPGRIIGTSDRTWIVDLQARTPARRNIIGSKWMDFSAAEHAFLHPYQADPWTVETSGDAPIVYLNTRYEDLKPLLHGADRTARDAVSTQIATDTWTALFYAAIDAAGLEDGEPIWPGGWRDAVIRKMLPDIYPDRSPEDALSEIVALRRRGDGSGDLHARTIHAVGRQAHRSRRLGAFLRRINQRQTA